MLSNSVTALRGGTRTLKCKASLSNLSLSITVQDCCTLREDAVCISSSLLNSKSNGVETLNNVLLIMHQIVHILAVPTSGLEQIN